MKLKPQFVYIAFDVFPSKKGAATHISHCLNALQKTFNVGLLICLGNDSMPTFQFDAQRNLYVYRWKEKIYNFLERTTKFQTAVSNILQSNICSNIQLIHFRDIWGGLPAIKSSKIVKTVFEINAFNHIELPNRYPNISLSAIQKIKDIERFCVKKASVIITPSRVTKLFISKFESINSNKIHVISNGVTIYESTNNIALNLKPHSYILYFGALQKWQGIKTLLKALKELENTNVYLVICASVPEKRTEIYQELAQTIGVNHKVKWMFELDKENLSHVIKNAVLTVAPLTACNRNIVQGCNPLKILESLAYGTPVVASDLPVVTEIIKDNKTGFLVPPDRPQILGRTIKTLLDKPEKLKRVGKNGKIAMEKNYLWKYQESKMINLYKSELEYV
ncbi:glycosyltransferase family 4 protein [Seonamhaeicola algicola]|uniref:Glycosyltransferase family 4 protein n=1 Tax=Seonamhaeicola algicola TaxID=1719036 RepID=A0A5C7AS71_9FLAO|nr:glycosyltransferase family 4 protein [Seonamhaeicola algicola]TXE11596.1 glycosyltransferase family 4 protein [Seonamhaeicola algicola]